MGARIERLQVKCGIAAWSCAESNADVTTSLYLKMNSNFNNFCFVKRQSLTLQFNSNFLFLHLTFCLSYSFYLTRVTKSSKQKKTSFKKQKQISGIYDCRMEVLFLLYSIFPTIFVQFFTTPYVPYIFSLKKIKIPP